MSNARDKANIPALNFSSTGIDDNATSTAVTIDSSENVGIGTTSPSRLLHLNTTGSGTNTYLQLTSDATGTGTLDGFQIIVAGSDGSTILTQRENSSLQFTTNNTERMRITSAGNVGIGTTSVSTKLQVTKASSGASGVLSAATVSLFENSGNTDIVIGAGNTSKSRIGFGDNGDAFNGRIDYDHSDRSMRFGTGGQAERMRIDSSGRVGIGTSSPSSLLHLSSNDPKIKLTDSDTGASHLLSGSSSVRNFDLVVDDGGSSGSPRFSVQIQNSGKFYILNNGNVGIGTSSPSEKLDVSGSINLTDNLKIDGSINFEATASSPSSESIYKPAPYSIAVNTNSLEMARFADSRLLINSTANVSSEYLLIKNNYTRTGMTIKSNTANAHHAIEFHNTNNQVGSINTSGSSVVYNTSSDYRLKENVSYDFDATARLKQLKPARFNFKADANTTVDGFLAHEVSSVVPEAISGEKDAVDEDGNPKYQGIDQSKLVPLLVKTIQELEARITTLEANNP